MYLCRQCGELSECSYECDSCECDDLEELGECANCGCLSTLEDHDRFGLCGSDGNNCQEDEELVEAFENEYIPFILEAADSLLK